MTLSDKKKHIKQSAEWLSSFHAAHRKGSARLDLTEKLSHLSKALSKVEAVLLKHSELTAALSWLESAAPDIQTHSIAFGLTHGDFKPENIIYSEGKTYGIDFLLEEESAQLMDLVQYANHLLFLTIKRKGSVYRSCSSEWTKHFLDSYIKDKNTIDLEVFFWLRLHHLLRYWSFDAGSINPFKLLQANKLRKMISLTYRAIRRLRSLPA